MSTTNALYSDRDLLRGSDSVASFSVQSDPKPPAITSDQWNEMGDSFEAGARGLALGGAIAAGVGQLHVAGAAVASSAIGFEAAKLARAQAQRAKDQEEAARRAAKEAKARELEKLKRDMSDAADRGMKEHRERMSRGDYRDPPTRERMRDISRMC